MTVSSRRPSRRHFALSSALLCMAVWIASPQDAAAREQPGGGYPHRLGMSRGAQMEARGARQAERAQQRAAARGAQEREVAAPRGPEREAPAAIAPAPPSPAPELDRSGRPGRLTPDERRALRQQINEAGRDVYRPIRP